MVPSTVQIQEASFIFVIKRQNKKARIGKTIFYEKAIKRKVHKKRSFSEKAIKQKKST